MKPNSGAELSIVCSLHTQIFDAPKLGLLYPQPCCSYVFLAVFYLILVHYCHLPLLLFPLGTVFILGLQFHTPPARVGYSQAWENGTANP